MVKRVTVPEVGGARTEFKGPQAFHWATASQRP